ncbi:Sulfate adenylyltransferase subunit 2 [Saccharolobus shibatae B12]|uniref:Sulfate adenylyltransferase subunit 2 n=1 Tax=Saccharolobus shibatae (strain ATCC 51178 / DSM 5389 / JCM 8931 / NBRC 15437 / B12) TaxID=523848 RepID=A0A8F5BNR9_SACSH|nr:phosphoadenosine phosphosulfate reductase family protein [Saccharolobus shibatae]QXJ28541.1 Sulfate adenylyltransferase subunit 2 [Saccharolobus shibatae B12]
MSSITLRGKLAEQLYEIASSTGLTPESYITSLLQGKSKKRVEYLPLDYKAKIAELVIEAAYNTFKKVVVVWSGGKDSTLSLYFAKKVAERLGKQLEAIIIDHYMHFDETWSFVEEVKKAWNVKLIVKGNEKLKGHKYGEIIKVPELSEKDRKELETIGYFKDSFPYALNNIAANHLLKTVPLKEAINEYSIDALIVGDRWDENPARSVETFFSIREDPKHFRVHPILLFTERDVWNFTLSNKLPIHPLYYRGFRSIDDKYETKPTGDKPAWEQDLENTPERAGRAQDKENIMEILRRHGYM